MKKFGIALGGALFSLTAFGQDLLQCVNPDVLNSLLYRGRSEMQMSVSPALPESMASFEAPDGFTFVGTAVRGTGALTNVAYRTQLSSAEAYAALVAAFAAEGWEVENSELSQPTRAIFNLVTGPVSGTVCRDGERRSLGVRDIDGTRYPTILISEQPQPRACNAEDRQRSMILARMSLITNDAPTLVFPASTRSATGDGLTGGGGGSGDTYQTSVRILSPDPASSLNDHLAAQMTEQGWQADANWSGRLSSGTRWTRDADDGTPMWVTLEIVALGQGLYDVSYRQMTPPY